MTSKLILSLLLLTATTASADKKLSTFDKMGNGTIYGNPPITIETDRFDYQWILVAAKKWNLLNGNSSTFTGGISILEGVDFRLTYEEMFIQESEQIQIVGLGIGRLSKWPNSSWLHDLSVEYRRFEYQKHPNLNVSSRIGFMVGIFWGVSYQVIKDHLYIGPRVSLLVPGGVEGGLTTQVLF